MTPRPWPLVMGVSLSCKAALVCGEGTHEADGACLPDAVEADGDSDSDTDSDTDADPVVDLIVCDDGSGDFTDLQDAVDAAGDGARIGLCPGTWDPVEVDRRGVSIVGLEGAERTFLDGGSRPAVTLVDQDLVLEELTLTGHPTTRSHFLIDATGGSLTLLNDRVSGLNLEVLSESAIQLTNVQTTCEGLIVADNHLFGALLQTSAGSLTLRHSVFSGNAQSSWSSSGNMSVLQIHYTTGEISNNLFVGNRVNSHVAELQSTDGLLSVFNNVFYGNQAAPDQTIAYAVGVLGAGVLFENNIVARNGSGVDATEDATVRFNDVFGNTRFNYSRYGGGDADDLELEPRFTDAEGGDFTLVSGLSPCIDAGNPLSGYDNVDGTRNDMGLYGGPYGRW